MKRGIEIEVKLAVADLRDAERRLRKAGARKVRRVFETNVLFDTPRATLRKRGHLARVREEKPQRGGRVRCMFTYKGPSLAGGRYKVRDEDQFEVSSLRGSTLVMKHLGLRPVYRYEKYRTTFALPRLAGLNVELDETPAGVFFELEGPPRAIDRAARRLGYRPADYITKSYLALYAELCRARGWPPGDMVFRRKKSP